MCHAASNTHVRHALTSSFNNNIGRSILSDINIKINIHQVERHDVFLFYTEIKPHDIVIANHPVLANTAYNNTNVVLQMNSPFSTDFLFATWRKRT